MTHLLRFLFFYFKVLTYFPKIFIPDSQPDTENKPTDDLPPPYQADPLSPYPQQPGYSVPPPVYQLQPGYQVPPGYQAPPNYQAPSSFQGGQVYHGAPAGGFMVTTVRFLHLN